MRILSFDPGGTTGWAFHELVSDQLTGAPKFEGGQIGPHDHHMELWGLMYSYHPDIIVYERFDYRIKKDKQGGEIPGIVLISKEYIGIIKLWQQTKPSKVKLVDQLPSHAGAGGKSSMSFWTDDKLKVIGVHTPANPHQNDATRHLLYYITEGELKRKDYLHAFKPNRTRGTTTPTT